MPPYFLLAQEYRAGVLGRLSVRLGLGSILALLSAFSFQRITVASSDGGVAATA